MILAETLQCTVPSPDAIKDATIYCVTGATNWPDIWMASAAAVSAAATIILAVFAVRAWRVSQETLRKMEKQIRTSESRVIEERQQAYLADYMLALKKMADSATDTELETSDLYNKAVDAWMLWSMDMLREHRGMRTLTGRLNRFYGEQAIGIELDYEIVVASINASEVTAKQDGAILDRIVSRFARQYLPDVRNYLIAIQDWQMNAVQREDIYASLEAQLSNIPAHEDDYV